MAAEPLPEGFYELLHTSALSGTLEASPHLEPLFNEVGGEEDPDVLTRHVVAAVKAALSQAKEEDRVGLANRLLKELNRSDAILEGPTQLHSLHRRDTLKRRQLRRPTTRLSDSALLTNSKDDPNLAAELRTEI